MHVGGVTDEDVAGVTREAVRDVMDLVPCLPLEMQVPSAVAEGAIQMPSVDTGPREAFLLSFQAPLKWKQGRGEPTGDILEVTFRILTLGDCGGGLRAEVIQMVCSHFWAVLTLW